MVKEKSQSFDQQQEQLVDVHQIILYNDDHNTFDFVIETLIDVCGHDPVKAEQCTLIVHYNGKCSVKSGDIVELLPISKEMTDRGLTVSIK
jgi:ATP-dependent Clp protease adaptor protein ClpS